MYIAGELRSDIFMVGLSVLFCICQKNYPTGFR